MQGHVVGGHPSHHWLRIRTASWAHSVPTEHSWLKASKMVARLVAEQMYSDNVVAMMFPHSWRAKKLPNARSDLAVLSDARGLEKSQAKNEARETTVAAELFQ